MSSQSSSHQTTKSLASDFHCYLWYGMGNNCNTYLFTNILNSSHPHVLIDPGHTFNEMGEDCLSSLTKAMEVDGFSIDDVGLIINTHSHIDHCQASEVLVQKNQTQITMSEEEDDFRLTTGERLNSMFGVKSPRFSPSFYVKEGTFEMGEGGKKLELQVLLTPGHSPGSICLYWPAKKILITGDVVFFGSIGRTDFPGGKMSALKESIHRLSQLDVEYIVPGHSTELGDIIEGKNV